MSRYHINPKTGNPNLCRAEKRCPFGGEHFDSKEEAREAYEAEQDPFTASGFARAQKEELLPELAAWVEPGPLGNFLNHPLVQDIMVDAAPGFANMRLRDKQKRLATAVEAQDWNTFIFLHERPYRFQALEEAIRDYGVDEPNQLISSVWIDSENIHQNYEGWGELLREHGIAMEASDEKILEELPEELTIYRGCTKAGEDGYSWTLDKEKAEWFGRRFARSGAQLLEARIPKTSVEAYLGRRGESEVVVLPENVVRESLRRTRL